MKKTIQRIILLIGLGFMLLSLGTCTKNRTGVCTGYSSDYNSTYCKDDWTEAECEEWNELQVNGVNWYFYAGQTCDDRGTPATP